MAHREAAATTTGLARLSEDIGQWRRTRAKLSPMPAELWRRATSLAQQLGIHPVQSALGLNYEALRSRVAAGASAGPPAASFVEVSGADVLRTTAGAVIELADGCGWRLTVRLPGGAPCDVAGLVEAFRRQG